MTKLPYPLWLAEVFQAVRTEIPQAHTAREAISDQVSGDTGQHDLTAMGDIAQPGTSHEHSPYVTAVAPTVRLARVQRQADSQFLALRPRLLSKCAPRINSCGQRVQRPDKHPYYGVARAFGHRPHPAVECDCRVDQFIVAGDSRPSDVLVTLTKTNRFVYADYEESDHPTRERAGVYR